MQLQKTQKPTFGCSSAFQGAGPAEEQHYDII